MALTLSGTNGVVGAGFTVDASGVSVTAGVGTFSSLQGSGANLTALPAANLTGALPAISAASCTSIPAANIVGLATAGFERTGGFSDFVKLQAASSSSAVSALVFSNLDVTTYRTFKFVLSTYPLNDGAELYLRVMDGNTYKTGANTYIWGQVGVTGASTSYGTSADDSFAKIGAGAGNNNYEGWRTELTFVPQVSGDSTFENNFGYAITQRFSESNSYRAETMYFRFNQSDVTDGFEIYTSNGNMGAYSYTLYGLKR